MLRKLVEETDCKFVVAHEEVRITLPLLALWLLLLLLLLHRFNGLISKTTWINQYQKGKTSLDLNKARDDGVLGWSGISWTICEQTAPHFRQITTPTPCHSIFTGHILFLTPSQQCQSTKGNSISFLILFNIFTYLLTLLSVIRHCWKASNMHGDQMHVISTSASAEFISYRNTILGSSGHRSWCQCVSRLPISVTKLPWVWWNRCRVISS